MYKKLIEPMESIAEHKYSICSSDNYLPENLFGKVGSQNTTIPSPVLKYIALKDGKMVVICNLVLIRQNRGKHVCFSFGIIGKYPVSDIIGINCLSIRFQNARIHDKIDLFILCLMIKSKIRESELMNWILLSVQQTCLIFLI